MFELFIYKMNKYIEQKILTGQDLHWNVLSKNVVYIYIYIYIIYIMYICIYIYIYIYI